MGERRSTWQQSEVRPFQVEVADEDPVDLRRRIAATRWPERETVDDATQGVQLGTMQELVRYWGSEYDFGRVEARLKPIRSATSQVKSSTTSR